MRWELITDLIYPHKLWFKLEQLCGSNYRLELVEDLSHLPDPDFQEAVQAVQDLRSVFPSGPALEIDAERKLLITRLEGPPHELMLMMISELIPRLIRSMDDLDGLLKLISSLGNGWLKMLNSLKGFLGAG